MIVVMMKSPLKIMMNECKIVIERVKLREPSLEIRVKNLTLKECKVG